MEKKMKIAVPTEGLYVANHFGRCPNFTIANIESGKVTSKTVVSSPGHDCESLPLFLRQHGVSCVITGGMGAGSQAHLRANQIGVVFVSGGHVDEVLKLYAEELLNSGENRCSNPTGEEHGSGHGHCDGSGHHHN